MLPALKFPGFRQQPDEYRLAHILGVLGIFQIGIAQAENRVGIGVGQPFRLLFIVHSINSFGARS